MIIDLEGHVAVVTGGGGGIGRDLVLRLAAEGVTTVALDVSQAGLAAVGEDLASSHVSSSQLVCDITDETAVQETVAEVERRYGRLDLLINNAGVGATAPIDLLSAQDWRRCQEVNSTGTFLMSKAAIPIMKRQCRGRILNAASFAAIVPSVAHAAYAASKAAVVQFTRAIAGELGPWNITVNAYAPGMVPTQLNHFTERPAEQQAVLLDTLTLRRWGSAEDLGNLICFLASDQADYITGTMVDVSGGKLATQVPKVAYDYATSGDADSLI